MEETCTLEHDLYIADCAAGSLPRPCCVGEHNFLNAYSKKVTSSYSTTLIKTVTVSRVILASASAGVTLDQLESGSRYSILLQPIIPQGVTLTILDTAEFFGCMIVKCTCDGSNVIDQTGMPITVSAVQSNGFVTLAFTDNSVCEEAYAFTRQQGQNALSIFAPNYYFYSTNERGNYLKPGPSFADDLSLSRLDIGVSFNYRAEAIALNYMASNVSIFTPNRVSSDSACKQVTIAWEASIKGMVTSKAETGSIPIDTVTITWTLMQVDSLIV